MPVNGELPEREPNGPAELAFDLLDARYACRDNRHS